ncbi:glucuronate isomerase [Brevibacillus fulvus]|uniref:Uronate isomerase n=1 Tax=Brevibacillus fulvus TaxID=1125967 RepID=A0A938XWW7_9BACL|nr:glucuronate isomerase [Brevibacillus fulvus]
MKPFLHEDFLLDSETAKKLYHQYAKDMPIFDYHCHLSAKEIAENRKFANITEAWLGGDHYKWRAMRSNGVSEEYITGEKSDKEKFVRWAETVPYLIGNPLYHWTHLELQRYFGITEPLSAENADNIWERCNTLLQDEAFTPRALLKRSNVVALCTTDDPTDSLADHRKLRDDPAFDVQVLPTFRPDQAYQIEKETFPSWVQQLEQATDMAIDTYHDFLTALARRIQFFHEAGCRLSDHSIESSFYREATEEELSAIFRKKLDRKILGPEEAAKFRSAVLLFLGQRYHQYGWAMQLHIGGLRNANTRKLHLLGPNTGYDSIADFCYAEDLARFLDALDQRQSLPKTILYCLNPRDNYMIAAMIGNFQEGVPGKLQFGSAWWFNDHHDGMKEQMKALANVGLLSRFIGMLTDSRSLLSFTRHEYFRRILCNLLGDWVERGEYPADFALLEQIVRNICFENIRNYLDMELSND